MHTKTHIVKRIAGALALCGAMILPAQADYYFTAITNAATGASVTSTLTPDGTKVATLSIVTNISTKVATEVASTNDALLADSSGEVYKKYYVPVPDTDSFYQSSVTNGWWDAVAYGNGTFVAASNGSYLRWSEDGDTWEYCSAAEGETETLGNNFASVIYAKDLFVAGCRNISGQMKGIWYSEDGKRWHQATLQDQHGSVTNEAACFSIAYGNGTFVSVVWPVSSAGDSLFTSTDGKTWTARAAATDSSDQTVAFANGVFVNTKENYTATSGDGNSWTGHYFSGCHARTVAYHDKFYSYGWAEPDIKTSTNGVDWVSLPYPTTIDNPYALAVADDKLWLSGFKSLPSPQIEKDYLYVLNEDGTGWELKSDNAPFTLSSDATTPMATGSDKVVVAAYKGLWFSGTKDVLATTSLLSKDDGARADAVAPAFSPAKAYEQNDFVMKDGALYQCTNAVADAGEWTGAANWKPCDVANTFVPVAGGEIEDSLNIWNDLSVGASLTVGSRKAGSTVGANSVAEGADTTASGDASHAEGAGTTAQNTDEHAQGRFNASHSASGTFGDAGNTLSSIGFGTADNARRNAVETMQDGKTFIYGLGGYDGTNPTNSPVYDLVTSIEMKADSATVASNLVAKADAVKSVMAGSPWIMTNATTTVVLDQYTHEDDVDRWTNNDGTYWIEGMSFSGMYAWMSCFDSVFSLGDPNDLTMYIGNGWGAYRVSAEPIHFIDYPVVYKDEMDAYVASTLVSKADTYKGTTPWTMSNASTTNILSIFEVESDTTVRWSSVDGSAWLRRTYRPSLGKWGWTSSVAGTSQMGSEEDPVYFTMGGWTFMRANTKNGYPVVYRDLLDFKAEAYKDASAWTLTNATTTVVLDKYQKITGVDRWSNDDGSYWLERYDTDTEGWSDWSSNVNEAWPNAPTTTLDLTFGEGWGAYRHSTFTGYPVIYEDTLTNYVSRASLDALINTLDIERMTNVTEIANVMQNFKDALTDLKNGAGN